jgi:hypothetical protein
MSHAGRPASTAYPRPRSASGPTVAACWPEVVVQARAPAQARVQARAPARVQAQAQARAQVRVQARAQVRVRVQARAKVRVRAQARAQAPVQARAQAPVQAQGQAPVQAQAPVLARVQATVPAPVPVRARETVPAKGQASATPSERGMRQALARRPADCPRHHHSPPRRPRRTSAPAAWHVPACQRDVPLERDPCVTPCDSSAMQRSVARSSAMGACSFRGYRRARTKPLAPRRQDANGLWQTLRAQPLRASLASR